jgi:hypothetical protein
MNKHVSVDNIRFEGRELRCLNLNGQVLDISNKVADWYQGPKEFNLFYVDFDGLFVDLIENVVEPEQRIKVNDQFLESLSFSSDEVEKLLDELVGVVNFSSRPIISEDRKSKYSEILNKIADRLSEFRKTENISNPDLTIVPMKGGSYFLNFLDGASIHERTLAIDCKRIPVAKTGSFCFGMRIDPVNEFPSNSDFKKVLIGAKKVRIVELCIVSGMTTIGFLLYLYKNNLKPELVEVDTIAMSQQGYKSIMEFAKQFGFNVKFVTGGVYYRLGNYYLSRRDELLTLDGKLVIGDVRSFLD